MKFDIQRKMFEIQRQKGGDLTQSYDKSPYTNRNVKGTKTDLQKSNLLFEIQKLYKIYPFIFKPKSLNFNNLTLKFKK